MGLGTGGLRHTKCGAYKQIVCKERRQVCAQLTRCDSVAAKKVDVGKKCDQWVQEG